MKARDYQIDDIARVLLRPAARVRAINRSGLDAIAGGLQRNHVPVF